MKKLFKKIDVTKIKGPYPVLALFLLPMQGFLGTWFYQAESQFERIIAGLLMTVLMIIFLIIILKIRLAEIGNKRISLEGFSGDVTPANQEATEQEINSPKIDIIASTDGSFTINKPPDNWIIEELTLADYLGETISITNKSFKEKMVNSLEVDLLDKVLTLKSKNIISVNPTPGVTIINGRKFPTALEVSIFTRLSILSINRFQKPYFKEKTLQYNVFQFISPMLRGGALNIRDLSIGEIKNSGRNFLTFEFNQKIENATINGKKEIDVRSHITVIGIEGELQDHLLIMNYPTFTNEAELRHEEDIDILKSLVDSFKPLKIIEHDIKIQENKLNADKNFEDLINIEGKSIFNIEFGMLLFRLSDWDMNDSKNRNRAIKQLLPFEILAKEVNYQDEDLDSFWESIHQAEEGEALNFKNYLKKFIKKLTDAEKANE